MTGVFDHLWQSTLFTAAVAILALTLRRNQARTRYWLWLAASCKFLVPFSLLVIVGTDIGSIIGTDTRRNVSPSIQPTVTVMIDKVTQPFTQVSALPPVPASRTLIAAALIIVWAIGCAIVLISWFRRWLRVRSAMRSATPMKVDVPLEAMSSPAMIEPGIFGVFRPVLLLPEGIGDKLTPPQLRSILAHELCHVRRRDNLASAFHMFVEAAFWFHPLVWWIGARLVEERERACDEDVLLSGWKPEIYAESILQVCKFYLESPLVCAAGVTGSDLKKRIESIMSQRLGRRLTPARKLILAMAGTTAIAGPVIFGIASAPYLHAQSAIEALEKAAPDFEVASVKPNKSNARGAGIPPPVGGRFNATNVSVNMLLRYAYRTQMFQISGGPKWLDDDRFDILAKASESVPESKIRPMILKLLAERFSLKVHHESKEMQVYALVTAKNGPKVQISEEGNCKSDPENMKPCGGFRLSNRRYLGGQQVSAEDLAEVLSWTLDHPVIDRTGIKGVFSVTLQWNPEDSLREPGPGDPGATPSDPNAPSIFTAIQEQIGLKLERQKASVDMVVVDSAQHPTDNNDSPAVAGSAPASKQPLSAARRP